MVSLNLKEHVCGAVKSKTKTLCSAADVEGHLGTDQKVCGCLVFMASCKHFLILILSAVTKKKNSFICLTFLELCPLLRLTISFKTVICTGFLPVLPDSSICYPLFFSPFFFFRKVIPRRISCKIPSSSLF